MRHNGRAKIQCVERIPYVISVGVSASAKTHRAVTVEELLEERAAGEPHPTASVHAPVCIQQQLLKHLRTHNKPQVNRETHFKVTASHTAVHKYEFIQSFNP